MNSQAGQAALVLSAVLIKSKYIKEKLAPPRIL